MPTSKTKSRVTRQPTKRPTRKVAAAATTSTGLFATSLAAVLGLQPEDPLAIVVASAILTYGPTAAAWARKEFASFGADRP